MILERIHSPADLRLLDAEELDVLAAEIRDAMIATTAANGGHLGSNLGAVELTLALHRAFDSPTDAIVWDTGHQAYTHKLVTGRYPMFSTLRRKGGLSGYPSRAESPHDWVENSHASVALSHACGLAAARKLAGHPGRVVAVVGDGALTGGVAWEALNNIGYRSLPVVVVLNDNGRSYAPTVSRLFESLSPLRLNPLTRDGLREPPPFFDALGLGYMGPIDGHDVQALEAALRDAAAMNGPVVVHVLTRKGRGYALAEDDDEKCLHDVSGPVRRRPSRDAPRRRYTDVFSAALVEAARRDPRIVAITAAMPGSTGLLPFAQEFPDRFFDVGIAEQHAVASAAGLALGGYRPVVAIYSTFLSRAFDQVNLDVALHRAPVVFCVDRAGITGPDGASHHGVLDLALLSRVPGMVVFAPSSAADLEEMLREALRREDGPTAIRWPNDDARIASAGSGRSGRLLRAGSDVCILAVGRLVAAAEAAAETLTARGLSVSVWDARCVTPVDPSMLMDAARHPLVVTVEDGVRDGGFGSHVAGQLAELGESRVVRFGAPSEHLPHGTARELLSELGLDASGIVASIERAWRNDAVRADDAPHAYQA
ncbi:MAG TPA: 1-deoxy-D-xylulose-5-phosphate synthase [Acidimicrobiales bacterium]